MFPVLVMSSSLDTNLVTLNRRPNSLSHKCFPIDWMTALAHWRASTTFYLANQRGRFSMLPGEQPISKLTIKSIFTLNSTCQLRAITTTRHPQQF